MIHRDLKPTNIVVDADGQPKVLDFGLARITDPDVALTISGTEIGKIMGTLPYMSPEEARGQPDAIDVRSDVYSLGVLFYELLTGQLPYTVKRAALHEAVRVICEEPPRRLSTCDRSLRGDLETIALKSLEKEPDRRYQSAAQLAEDIRRFQANEPILARRAGGLYRFRKLVARHRILFAFSAMLLGVIAGAGLFVRETANQLWELGLVQMELADLTTAIGRLDLAEARFADGNYDKAERPYRDALSEFRRLDRHGPRYTGRAMLGLAIVLLSREPPIAANLDEAEELLLEAVDIFDSDDDHQNQLGRTREALEFLQARRETMNFADVGEDDVNGSEKDGSNLD